MILVMTMFSKEMMVLVNGHLIEGDIEQGAGGHPLQDSYGQQMASTRLKARTYDQSKLKKR